MNLLAKTSAAAALLTALALPSLAVAKLQASCSVTVEYSLNQAVVESYVRDFEVTEGVVFSEDFSTPTRQKGFSASATRVNGKAAVTMSYFSDVSTFNTIDLLTSVNLVKGRLETTEGRHVFSTSLGTAGNHLTHYVLSCQRL